MSTETWDEGFAAHNNGDDIDDCPYSWGENKEDWLQGWNDALEYHAFGKEETPMLALAPETAEPNINWLALADDEVADLLDFIDGSGFDAVCDRLRAMIFCKPLLLVVDND